MGVEEQIQEIEVLQSIYPDELTQISDNSYTIHLALEPPSILGQDYEPRIAHLSLPPLLVSAANEGKIVTAIVVLRVEYPPTYPDIAPTLDLTIDPSSPPSSLSFPDDKDTLLDALAPVVEENLGMEMIFTLTTTLKEAAEEILLTRAQEKENAREEKIRREEEKEMEKFRGNLVTRERFIQWRENFLAEMEEKKRREKEKEDEEKSKRGGGGGGGGGASLKEKRMTGRELYEKGLVGAADEEDTEADGEVVDVGKLKIQA